MRSWPDARRPALAALVAAVAALGVAAAWQGFAWPDTRSWVPDLLAGWTLAGLGLAALATGRPRGAAALLLVAGVAWFFGDFWASDAPGLGWVGSHLGWLFLAPLVQLALAYPSGRPRTVVSRIAVAATWVAAATTWLDWNDDTTLAASLAALTAVAVVETVRAGHDRLRVLPGLGGLLLLLVWALAVPRVGSAGDWSLQPTAFEVGIALVGVWLFAWLPRSDDLAERAIELDESTGTLRDALAQLLHDPALEVGFASGSGSFVDEFGRVIAPPPSGRIATELVSAEHVVGVVVHDRHALTTRDDREAVAIAVSLAAARARLRQDLRLQADAVSRSTVRLIQAEDDERLRLAARLGASTGRSLREAAGLLAEARSAAAGQAGLQAAIDEADEQLARTRAELTALAGGLGVPALTAGLPAALAELVDGLPLDVDAQVADVECTSEMAATIWFVCSEGVANVLKHAGASRLRVELVERPTDLRLLVEDDGRGGADATGSGLAGLRDRVTALGGKLGVEPVPTGGTRLVALLPHTGGTR
jgi:signal transduction histidine kinase